MSGSTGFLHRIEPVRSALPKLQKELQSIWISLEFSCIPSLTCFVWQPMKKTLKNTEGGILSNISFTLNRYWFAANRCKLCLISFPFTSGISINMLWELEFSWVPELIFKLMCSLSSRGLHDQVIPPHKIPYTYKN